MIVMATPTISGRTGRRLTTKAPKGAAMTPTMEMVDVTRNSVTPVESMTFLLMPAADQRCGDDGSPAVPAHCVEHTTNKTDHWHQPVAHLAWKHQLEGLDHDVDANGDEVGGHEGLDHGSIDTGQHVGANGAPSGARRATSLPLMLRCQTWEAPDAAVAKTSATWVMALALAAGTPKASIEVVAIRPNAVPSAPSTICAQKPTMVKNARSRIRNRGPR